MLINKPTFYILVIFTHNHLHRWKRVKGWRCMEVMKQNTLGKGRCSIPKRSTDCVCVQCLDGTWNTLQCSLGDLGRNQHIHHFTVFHWLNHTRPIVHWKQASLGLGLQHSEMWNQTGWLCTAVQTLSGGCRLHSHHTPSWFEDIFLNILQFTENLMTNQYGWLALACVSDYKCRGSPCLSNLKH